MIVVQTHGPASSLITFSYTLWDARRSAVPSLTRYQLFLQVHALNALNVILIHTSRKERSAAHLMIYEGLLCRAIDLLAQDRECTRLAPKAVLTCALLLQLGAGWICRAVDADLLLLADRLASKSSDASCGSVGSTDKELADYSAQCVGVLLQSVIQGTPQVLEEVCGNTKYQIPNYWWTRGHIRPINPFYWRPVCCLRWARPQLLPCPKSSFICICMNKCYHLTCTYHQPL